MLFVIFALSALTACTTAIPRKSPIYLDVYTNSLIPSPRIVGGQKAERNQFPYLVSLRWHDQGASAYTHLCAGALIKENLVLTIAACGKYLSGNCQVALGQFDQSEDDPDVQLIEAADVILHPKYTEQPDDYNIALIKLKTAAKLSKAVQLTSLPVNDDCNAIENVIASGWGVTSNTPQQPTTIYWAQLPRISNEQCRDALIHILGHSTLNNATICTGSNSGIDQSACFGDLGNPIVLAKNGKLVGITSWFLTTCGSGMHGAPTGYIRVCSFLDFISKYV